MAMVLTQPRASSDMQFRWLATQRKVTAPLGSDKRRHTSPGTTVSHACSPTQITWQVLDKMQRSLEAGQHYEAHQMLKTVYYRFRARKQQEEAYQLLQARVLGTFAGSAYLACCRRHAIIVLEIAHEVASLGRTVRCGGATDAGRGAMQITGSQTLCACRPCM